MKNAIKKIMEQVTDECVITSCGYISREVFRYDRPRNFYNLGAMGSSLSIGLGLAFQRPDLKVIVIQGDGATLMSMGTIVLNEYLALKNIEFYMLDNNSFASTGGQKTCSGELDYISFRHNVFFIGCGTESDAPRVSLSCKEIRRRFCEAIHIKEK